jgi:hypothetical protein
MTMLADAPGMHRTTRSGPRVAALLFATLLCLQCVWLTAAELIQPGVNQLPTSVAAAAAAATKRVAASVAASIGVLRGNLWAQSAYTYANLLWPEDTEYASVPASAERARQNLDRALRWGPTQSGAWLLLAGLGQEFRLTGAAPTEALKMSYYTGPTEMSLIPLRLSVAIKADRFDDFEIHQFVGRDLRLLLAQDKKTAIAAVYRTASPTGKSFIEQTVADIDPSALPSLRAAAPSSLK